MELTYNHMTKQHGFKNKTVCPYCKKEFILETTDKDMFGKSLCFKCFMSGKPAINQNRGILSMKLKYTIDQTQIDDMEMIISISMSVSQWLAIMRTKTQAAHYEPIGKLQNAISEALGDLTNATNKKYEIEK